MVQTVTVNKNSLATFTNVPVGTFYLKEKQPSSEDYVGSSETYRIISTLKGVQVYDSKGQLLGETMNEETREEEESIEQTEELDSKEPTKDEPIVLLELKNHLVKGIAELTKTDVSDGKTLPNTGIRILDKNKKVVIEGKTDNQGQFTFEKLPKGVYYFQEFDAHQVIN